jgi:hypothetical protein
MIHDVAAIGRPGRRPNLAGWPTPAAGIVDARLCRVLSYVADLVFRQR